MPFKTPTIPLKFFNTETRHKEAFHPLQSGKVSMYTCGPTVYHFAHIGNFRAYMFEDLLRRTLEYFGYDVTQVMNITDLDDKTIVGAIKNNVTLAEYTRPYTQAFFDDLKTLNIQPAATYPAATDYIPEMIHIIEVLLAKGTAYKGADGSVYFSISKFPKYGRLSHLQLDELKAGASQRVSNDEYGKDHVSDFALWKGYDKERDGTIFWESPFGPGRPGWHLECSAMAMKILGPSIDIHCGGVDNMFPHHENEIAQSEAYSEKPFVKMWIHAEHLLVDQKKMSKSLGNFYTLRDLLSKGYTGRQVRYILIQTHYKTQLNFTFAGVEGVKVSLQRLQDFIYRLQTIQGNGGKGEVIPHLTKTFETFSYALADDLNISAALAALFDMVREVNGLCDANSVSHEEAQATLELLQKFNQVLGFLEFAPAIDQIPQEMEDLLSKRNEARKQKNWALADQMRVEIHNKGYVIEDTPSGARLKKGG